MDESSLSMERVKDVHSIHQIGDFWRRLIPLMNYDISLSWQTTVPTCNSCTKCVGGPGHNIQLHARLATMPSFLAIDAWMTSQLNVAFITQVMWVIDVLGLFSFWNVTPGILYNQALADVWSTGARNIWIIRKCLLAIWTSLRDAESLLVTCWL